MGVALQEAPGGCHGGGHNSTTQENSKPKTERQSGTIVQIPCPHALQFSTQVCPLRHTWPPPTTALQPLFGPQQPFTPTVQGTSHRQVTELKSVLRRLASEIMRDVRTLERKIADLNERIEAEVEASGTTLTEIFGVGSILAAKIIGTIGSVARFPTKAHFASYSGTAPVEASSGEMVRHRLSLAGNRNLNNALHMVAVCQARSDARGRAYYRKKMAEGKSRKEALRCLKRRISDAVFKSLMTDLQEPSRSVA
jgi:Transposase IS116/IS110/IS902 family